MPYCRKCGKPVNESDAYCPSCGNKTEPDINEKAETAFNDFTEKVSDINNTQDTTSEYDEQDIKDNKVFAVLAYLGILVLVPIFGASNSKYARFHANQGLVLLIAEVAYGILTAMITAIAGLAFGFIFKWMIRALLSFISLGFLAFVIIGIINAVNGKAKQLPLIGSIKILK